MKDDVWHKIGIVTLTLPLGFHRRNTVHDNIGKDVMLFLMPVDVVWSDLSWELLWFSFLSVFCLAGLYAIVSLYVCKCSLYSCQSFICLQSTQVLSEKKISYFCLFFFFFLFNIMYVREMYVCMHMYRNTHCVCIYVAHESCGGACSHFSYFLQTGYNFKSSL